jgi:hypothetical protein
VLGVNVVKTEKVKQGNPDIAQEIKNDSWIVATWVLHYHERRKEYNALLEKYDNIQHGGKGSVVELVPIRGNLPGDQVGRKGMRMAELGESIERYEKWLDMVEYLEQHLPWKLQLILHIRWDSIEKNGKINSGKYRGRPAWIPYAQHRYCKEVAERTGKRNEDVWVDSPDTFQTWWGKIVSYATVVAAKRKLI